MLGIIRTPWDPLNPQRPKPYNVSFKLYLQELLTQIEEWVQTHDSTLVDAKMNHALSSVLLKPDTQCYENEIGRRFP